MSLSLFSPVWFRIRSQQPRIVYLARSVDHAVHLQKYQPFDLIGLPSLTKYAELKKKDIHWPTLCAVGNLWMPWNSLDIIQHTDCAKLVLGSVLIQFDAKKRGVISHEMVELSRT